MFSGAYKRRTEWNRFRPNNLGNRNNLTLPSQASAGGVSGSSLNYLEMFPEQLTNLRNPDTKAQAPEAVGNKS